MVTRCFTFGYGHTDKITGQSLGDTYARITARSLDECFMVMHVLYGNQWAFDYPPEAIEAMNQIDGQHVKLHLEVTIHE